MLIRGDYQTTRDRVVLALLIGPAVAGLATVIAITQSHGGGGDVNLHGLSDVLVGLWIWAVILFFASLPYAMGAVLLGSPIWWLLHRIGYRGPLVALALGAVLSFLVVTAGESSHFVLPSSDGHTFRSDEGGVLVDSGRLTAYGWTKLLTYAAKISAGGALGGLVIWRVAYRRPRTSAQRP